MKNSKSKTLAEHDQTFLTDEFDFLDLIVFLRRNGLMLLGGDFARMTYWGD